MGKTEYELLMSQIDAIAEKVTTFPKHMQETVYRHLVDTLLDREPREDYIRYKRTRSNVNRQTSMVSRNISSIDVDKRRIRSYYHEYELDKANDMQFAAACAHFLSELASPETKRNTIDETTLQDMCEILGREPPGNARSTLNNARRLRNFFDVVVPGQYALAKKGRDYVRSVIKKESAT